MASAMLLTACSRPMTIRPVALDDDSPTPWRTLATGCKPNPQSPADVVCSKEAVRAAGHACLDIAEDLELCQADADADSQFCRALLEQSRDRVAACEIALEAARSELWLWFGGGAGVAAILSVIIGFSVNI
jgi:hypothetical protein